MRTDLANAPRIAVMVLAAASVLAGGCGGNRSNPFPHRLGSGASLARPRDGRPLGRPMDARSLGTRRSPGKPLPARSLDGPPPTDEPPQTQPAVVDHDADR